MPPRIDQDQNPDVDFFCAHKSANRLGVCVLEPLRILMPPRIGQDQNRVGF
jgi:hypothetical protein